MSLELFINSGSITEIDLSRIDGVRFEDAFSVSSTTCATLYYNVQDFSIPPVTPVGVLNIPETNYFMFDENAASDWNATTPTKIRISLKALGRILDRTNYQQKLFDIIKNRRVDSEITLTKLPTLNDSDPKSLKKFKITEANYLERTYDDDGQKFYSLEWGGTDLTETADFTGLFDYLPSSEDRKDGFFTLTVQQLDSEVNNDEPPSQGDELLICIKPSAKYGLLDVVDANFDNLNIDNVDVISGSMDVLEISSSITINGELLPNVFGISPKPIDSTVFKFSETTWNYDNVFYGIVGSIPSEGYFMFDQDSSINGEYGDSQWRNSKPKNIRINLKSFDNSLESDTVFKNKLFDILKNGYGGSKISVYQQVGNDIDVQAYKEFEIEYMFYLEKRIIDGVPYYYEILWGEKDFRETEDRGYFDGNIDKLDTALSDKNTTGFFEIKVKQTNPDITRTYTNPPIQGQDFKVIVDVKAIPSKEITFITESRDYVVPSWAKKLTIYAVGAGGGGGAGSNGFGHHPGMGLLENAYIDQTTGEPVYDDSSVDERFSTPEFLEKIGHEVVTGGGGGAGGSVVIAEYDIKDAITDTASIQAEITRMQTRVGVINNIYAQRELYLETDGADGLYIPEEEIKVLMDEANKLNADIQKLQLQLAVDTGGIPANSILTVLVGSPGKGGKGRIEIDDHPIDTELIRESNDNISILDYYKREEYNQSTMWKSLWFQREFPRLPQKSNAVQVFGKLALAEKTLNEIGSDLITGFLTGKITLITLGFAGQLLEKLIGAGYDANLEVGPETNMTVDSDKDIRKQIRYLLKRFGNNPNAIADAEEAGLIPKGSYGMFYNIMFSQNHFSINEYLKFENQLAYEKLIKLQERVKDAVESGIHINEAFRGFNWLKYTALINTLLAPNDASDVALKDFILLDIIQSLRTNTDLINEAADNYKGNLKDLLGRIGLYEYLQFNVMDITTENGRDIYNLYSAFYGHGKPGFMFDKTVDEDTLDIYAKHKLGIIRNSYIYQRILNSLHIDEYAKQIYPIKYTGPNSGGIIAAASSFGIGVGATTLLNNIPQLSFVMPYLSTLTNFASAMIDLTTSNEIIAHTKIYSNFNKNGISMVSPHPTSIPRGLTLDIDSGYTYTYETIRRNPKKFYHSKQAHSANDSRQQGKNGGNTEIYLNKTVDLTQTSECILRASGGIGGSSGYAYRGMLNPLARSLGENFDAYSTFIVPGGYGPAQIPFSKRSKSSTLINGGPGAYGIAAPTLTTWTFSLPDKYISASTEVSNTYKLILQLEAEYQESIRQNGSDPILAARIADLYSKLEELQAIMESDGNIRIDFGNLSLDQDTFKANVALSLPNIYGKNNGEVDYYSNLRLSLMPFYGKSSSLFNKTEKNTTYQIDGFINDRPPGIGIGVIGSSDKLNLEGYKKISETPMPSPPGGGGGCGVTWQLLDMRDTKVPYFYAKNYPNRVDQYKIQSEILKSQVYLGLGGKILLGNTNRQQYIFRDTDPTTGELIEIEIKNGGNGGFGEYYATDGTRITARKQIENKPIIERLNNDLSVNYELPEDVSDRWGVGGGGGAAHYETNWNNRPLVSTFTEQPPLDPFSPQYDTYYLKNHGEYFHNPVQDGADGGPGVVVIVAEP